jgi:DNA-binding transcriptional MerR regulator
MAPGGVIAMRFEALKVGELARRTGLTIRTLHHYDEIGLLKPSLHTESGHRLYTAADVARLQQVISLRQLGFSLEEVGGCLNRPDFSPLEVIRLHVARLRQQIELQRGLCERLEALAAYFQPAGVVSAEAFLQAIEVMNMIEVFFTIKPNRRKDRSGQGDPTEQATRLVGCGDQKGVAAAELPGRVGRPKRTWPAERR